MKQTGKSAEPNRDGGRGTRPESAGGDGAKNLRMVLTLPGSGVEMAFRKIAAPKKGFLMGSRGREVDEEPVHCVRLGGDFWISETPVTQRQFRVSSKQYLKSHTNNASVHPDHPAVMITWKEANEYCSWIADRGSTELKKLGIQRVCLPTEAEWEFACRAGTSTDYYTGDGDEALKSAGWFTDNSGVKLKPVSLRVPNDFGLHDMHGNVSEWCHDERNSNLYRNVVDGDTDPQFEIRENDWNSGVEKFTSDEACNRIIRGGSYGGSSNRCRSAARYWVWKAADRNWSIGFRVCLVPMAKTGEQM